MAMFTWSGIDVVYDETGPADAVPILFVHGWTANRHRWDAQVRDLSDRHRCIRLDLPGHGESGPPASYRVDALADCVLALADHLGVERFVLAGHSMGGMIGLLLALRVPDRVRELVLVDSIARFVYDPARALLVRAAGLLPFGLFVTINIRRAFARGFPRARVSEFVAQARTNDESVVRGFYEQMLGFDVLDRVGAIRCPVVIVHGSKDIQLPLSQAVRMAERMPRAVIRVLDCGHEAPVEAPEAVTAAIRDLITPS